MTTLLDDDPRTVASAAERLRTTMAAVRVSLSCCTWGRQEIQSLLVAAPWQERLEYAGRLSCGWTGPQKAQLGSLLASRIRAQPVVPCPKKARWVEPDLYCRVQFLQRTLRGRLRGASFRGLIDGLT